jgi:hypothetical protein
VLGPATHVKAGAMQATECEIEAQPRVMRFRNDSQRADNDRERLWQALAG